MSDFDKLKQMNIEEIKNITKISTNRLHDIINKNFKSLDSTRAQGFIKILERDLNLNLSDWVQEYNDFLQNKNGVKSKADNSPKISDTTQNKDSIKQNLNSSNIEVSIPKQKPKLKKNILVITLSVVVLAILVFTYFISSDTSPNKKQNVSKENIANSQKEQVNQDYPKISLGEALEKDNASKDSSSIESSSGDISTISIKAKKEVWFEWIDTKTRAGGQKVLRSKDSAFSLDSINPIAFHFGNGLLEITADGMEYDYTQGSVTYLLYTPGEGFKSITRKEYMALGGK